jgi:excisionase family DNA binding protein
MGNSVVLRECVEFILLWTLDTRLSRRCNGITQPMNTNTRNNTSDYLTELPLLLSIDEVADLLRLKRRSITRMLQQGRLKSTKLTRSRGTAGRRLILRSSLEKLIQNGLDDHEATR